MLDDILSIVIFNLMALSKSVESSLKEAEACLRNALSYAARQERPMVCSVISKMISEIDQVISFDGILDKIEKTLEFPQEKWEEQ